MVRDPSEPTNTMLVGADAPVSAAALRGRAARMPADLQPVADAAPGRLAAPLRGGRGLHGRLAPVEWLIDASIVQVAARGER